MSNQSSLKLQFGVKAIGASISAIVGVLVGWPLDGPLGGVIGLGLGALSGWVLSGAIVSLNDGQVGRILRGALIGLLILGGIGGSIMLIFLDTAVFSAVSFFFWMGIVWGTVVFADVKAALKWAAAGAAFGPAVSLLVLISVATMGTVYPGRLLTIQGIVVLVAVTTSASALLTLTGRLFVGNLVQALLVRTLEEIQSSQPTGSDSILITFATTYGSTREVAEVIAETLRERGLVVDVRPMRRVGTLNGYRAIVLGAPLYMFRWHKDARRFLSHHRQTLAERPVAVFALGPFGAGDEKEWQGAREQLDKELAAFPWFAPVAVEIIGGKLDPGELRFPFRLSLHQIPANDLRDWEAIRAWAGSLEAEL